MKKSFVLFTVLLSPRHAGSRRPPVTEFCLTPAGRGRASAAWNDGPALVLRSTRATRVSFAIAGIYEPTPDPQRLGQVPREVRMHLPDLLELTRPQDALAGAEPVEGINVRLKNPAEGTCLLKKRAGGPPGRAGRSGEREPAARSLPGARTLSPGDRHRHDRGGNGLPARPDDHAGRRTPRNRGRAPSDWPAGPPHPHADSHRRRLVASGGALFGLVLALLSQGLINRFFQWRYDTALVFVHITPSVAATCVWIAVPLGASATVCASWALLRRSGLRLVRR